MNYTLRIPNQEDIEPSKAGEHIVNPERSVQQNSQPISYAPNSGRSLRHMIETEPITGEDERRARTQEIRSGIVDITSGADLLVRKRLAVINHPHILDTKAIELDLKEKA